MNMAVRTSFWFKDVRRRQSRGIGLNSSLVHHSGNLAENGRLRSHTHHGEYDKVQYHVYRTAPNEESVNVDTMSGNTHVPK